MTQAKGLSLADLGAGMSSIVARDQANKRAFDALRRIRLADQELLEFYYLDEKTGTQLAELYGIPENTLRSRLRRAREAWQAERTAGIRVTPAEEFERHTNVLQLPPNPEPEPVG